MINPKRPLRGSSQSLRNNGTPTVQTSTNQSSLFKAQQGLSPGLPNRRKLGALNTTKGSQSFKRTVGQSLNSTPLISAKNTAQMRASTGMFDSKMRMTTPASGNKSAVKANNVQNMRKTGFKMPVAPDEADNQFNIEENFEDIFEQIQL